MLKYITLIVFVISSLFATAQKGQTFLDSMSVVKDSSEMLPIVVYKDTIFFVQNGLGSKTIRERADDISRKSEDLINDFSFEKKKLKIDSNEFTTFIKYEENIIVAIGAEDEISFGKNRSEIAKLWLGLLGKKIEKEHQERSYKSILLMLGLLFLY